jgi:hypothetical protein
MARMARIGNLAKAQRIAKEDERRKFGIGISHRGAETQRKEKKRTTDCTDGKGGKRG